MTLCFGCGTQIHYPYNRMCKDCGKAKDCTWCGNPHFVGELNNKGMCMLCARNHIPIRPEPKIELRLYTHTINVELDNTVASGAPTGRSLSMSCKMKGCPHGTNRSGWCPAHEPNDHLPLCRRCMRPGELDLHGICWGCSFSTVHRTERKMRHFKYKTRKESGITTGQGFRAIDSDLDEIYAHIDRIKETLESRSRTNYTADVIETETQAKIRNWKLLRRRITAIPFMILGILMAVGTVAVTVLVEKGSWFTASSWSPAPVSAVFTVILLSIAGYYSIKESSIRSKGQ